MPPWWKGIVKGKSKTSSNSSATSEPSIRSRPEWKEEEEEAVCSLTPKLLREVKKEKANSFDGVILGRKATGTEAAVPAASGHGGESVFAFGHPLPRPSASSPLPSPPPLDPVPPAVSGSASASSISSSGSSEDTPDLGFYRLSEPINLARGRQVSTEPQRHHYVADRRRFSCSPVLEHPRSYELPVSPKKEIHLHGFNAMSNDTAFSCSPVLEHPRSYELPVSPKKEIHLNGFNAMSNDTAFSAGVTYPEIISNPRTVSCAPSSRGSPLSCSPRSSSPIHPVALRVCPGSPTGRQDELRSPSHPLPLPPTSPTSPSSFSPHSSQTQWKKGKLLGRGTFGHVYLGFNSESGQMCAIKEVTAISDDSNSRESLKQLNQEINLLSQLSHPNIVQYYGSELIDETLAVYLEYVSGGSIHKLLQEYGPFGESVIRNYTAQILSGLAYLHGRNTMHRDIKGANILVDPNGGVKLADFGMAKHISSYTSIRSFKGSPYWMAPEVIMNISGYNLSVDIWSLGCTVLEMATSKPPWSQFEGVAAIFKIGNSKDIPDIPDQLSSEAKSFVRLSLLRDPSARPTAAQLMDHPFVCDQPAIKAAKSSMTKDMLPSSSDGSYSRAKSFRFNGSISPRCEKEYMLERWDTEPVAHKGTSDLMGMRMNMSLPVSPCSSPLRQFRQGNRTCFPSPTHPAFSAGAVPYGPSNYYHQVRSTHNFPDPSLDIAELNIQTPYNRQRR